MHDICKPTYVYEYIPYPMSYILYLYNLYHKRRSCYTLYMYVLHLGECITCHTSYIYFGACPSPSIICIHITHICICMSVHVRLHKHIQKGT